MRVERFEDAKPRAVPEMMVEHHHIELARENAIEPVLGARDMFDGTALAPKRLLDQTAQSGIVVNVKNTRGAFWQFYAVSGTCMTEKNSPSCRMAVAKPS